MLASQIYITGDRRYSHLRHTTNGRLLALLFGAASRSTGEPHRQSWGTIPRADQSETPEVCLAFLAAKDALEAGRTEETVAAYASAKGALTGRLLGARRHRIKSLGYVFHLHVDGGISVNPVLAKRFRHRVLALLKSFA